MDEDIKEDLYEKLKDEGIRMTRQRKAIVNLLIDNKRPMTASDIYTILSRDDKNLRLSTIYRNLNMFVKKKVVRKIDLNIDKKENYFEFIQGEHHHHLVCVKCNEIIPFDCPLQEYEKEISERTNYHILDHKIKMYGICPQCKKIIE
ncbi:MAG: Fur family transcriptional regulator [Bacillota bacterium]